eukprot:1160512-Pelagomonas_calceolata.AAC.4
MLRSWRSPQNPASQLVLLACYDAQAARGEFGDDEKKGQKEITLKDDVPSEARALLYRDYLMSTMSGA